MRVGEGNALPMAGGYEVDGVVVRFTPMYGFDAGRTFSITVDPRKIPEADANEQWRQPLMQVHGMAAAAVERTTEVRRVYPSGPRLPENTLRLYIEFSGPMGRGDALPHIKLVDEAGREVVDPFLPVEAEFWSPDRTRFTLFFDPGRVKRGIKPNRDMGRALIEGKKYSLVIDDRWLDGQGAPLKSTHRHDFVAGASVERPLDPSGWAVEAPRAGSREPLAIRFPWGLDRGLLQRTLVVRNGAASVAVQGDITIEHGETRWTFVPRVPWTPGSYTLDVATSLEDPAGNRIGRAFEVTQPQADERDTISIPVHVR